jgi:CO dehydrogenase maturation factor
MKLAVCGKGGSGKSTVTCLLAKQALKICREVLVVDADDSNSGIYKMLGFDNPPVPLMSLVGGKSKVKENMGKGNLLTRREIEIQEIPSEYIRTKNGLMLVGIGKILQALEGCACPMGVLSREFLKKLQMGDGRMAIVDMEAGIEHFGRGIDEFIDQILIVVEPSYDSLNIAVKIKGLATDLNKKAAAVINKSPSAEVSSKIADELARNGLSVIGDLPSDPLVFEAGLQGNTTDEGKAFNEAGKVLGLLMQKTKN